MSGYLYGTRLYDTNNTGYYWDGASTTVCNVHHSTSYVIRTNTNTYWSTQDLKLYGVSPTITFADSGSKTMWLHNNANQMEFIVSTGNAYLNLSQGNNSTRPLLINLNNLNSYFGNNVSIAGQAFQNQSDGRLKTNLRKIDRAVDKINSLNGCYFDWIDSIEEIGAAPQKRMKDEVGLIAQEVEKIMPQVVSLAPFDRKTDDEGKELSKSGENYLTVQYEKLVPLLVEGIKEQQSTIESLTARIETLEKQCSGCI